MSLELQVHYGQTPVVLVLSGDLDIRTCSQFRDCLTNLISQGNQFVMIDLEQVGFVDSAGLGVLVGCLKRLRGIDGDLSLRFSQRNLTRLLEITGLMPVFRVEPAIG